MLSLNKRLKSVYSLTPTKRRKTATEIMRPTASTSSLVISAGALSEATAAATVTDSEPQLNVGVSNGVVKKERPRTSEEQIAASKEKHPLLPPCTNECRRKCCQKISPVHRADIHEQFWTKAYDCHRKWLFHHIVREKFNVQGQPEKTLVNHASQVLGINFQMTVEMMFLFVNRFSCTHC